MSRSWTTPYVPPPRPESREEWARQLLRQAIVELDRHDREYHYKTPVNFLAEIEEFLTK